MSVGHMPIIDVVYENVEGYHRFTSPQIPGLYVIVEPKDFEAGLDDVPEAIRILIEDKGKNKVAVHRVPTFDSFIKRMPEKRRPHIFHYSVETIAA